MGLFGFGKKKKETCEYVSLPVRQGMLSMLDGRVFVVIKTESSGKKYRRWYTINARELESGEIIQIMVGWNEGSASPDYRTTCHLKFYRPGYTKEDSLMLTLYSRSWDNVRYPVLSGEFHLCVYNDDCTCFDLETLEQYDFLKTTPVKEVLKKVNPGDTILVCKYQDQVYFAACAADEGGPSILRNMSREIRGE